MPSKTPNLDKQLQYLTELSDKQQSLNTKQQELAKRQTLYEIRKKLLPAQESLDRQQQLLTERQKSLRHNQILLNVQHVPLHQRKQRALFKKQKFLHQQKQQALSREQRKLENTQRSLTQQKESLDQKWWPGDHVQQASYKPSTHLTKHQLLLAIEQTELVNDEKLLRQEQQSLQSIGLGNTPHLLTSETLQTIPNTALGYFSKFVKHLYFFVETPPEKLTNLKRELTEEKEKLEAAIREDVAKTIDKEVAQEAIQAIELAIKLLTKAPEITKIEHFIDTSLDLAGNKDHNKTDPLFVQYIRKVYACLNELSVDKTTKDNIRECIYQTITTQTVEMITSDQIVGENQLAIINKQLINNISNLPIGEDSVSTLNRFCKALAALTVTLASGGTLLANSTIRNSLLWRTPTEGAVKQTCDKLAQTTESFEAPYTIMPARVAG